MATGNYVDGFVIPIPKKNTAKYKKMATEASRVWKKFGALDYKECILEDPKPPFVTVTFPKMAKTKPGETVWFSFIVFKSKAHRNAVNKKVMAFFEKKYGKEEMSSMPFDMKRFAYAGFKVIVKA
jgi:uncharacterized protein YbaA (DUF1428 family)